MIKRNYIAVVALALVGAGLIMGLASCNCGSRTEPTAAETPAPRVLATVGEHTITAEAFEAYLAFKGIKIRSDEQLDAELQRFTQREAVAQAVRQTELLQPAAIEAEITAFRHEMLPSRYFEAFLRTAVPREAVEQYYKEHEDDYSTRRVRVGHILVRSKRNASDEDRSAHRKKIDDAYAQLQTGKDFAEIAKVFSDDRVSANRGGDMGWIQPGAIDPRFSEVAFSLTEGTFSEPIETGFGYHILKVLEGPKTRRKPLSAVEGDIRHALRGEAKTAEMARLEDLVAIEIDRGDWHPAVQPIVARTVPQAEVTPSESAQVPGAVEGEAAGTPGVDALQGEPSADAAPATPPGDPARG